MLFSWGRGNSAADSENRGKADAADLSGLIRWRMVWEGDVQGVGFRYSARALAAETGVTGWVRNLPDGTVEAEVQGSLSQIGAFDHGIREFSASPHSWIDARLAERKVLPPKPERRFEVR